MRKVKILITFYLVITLFGRHGFCETQQAHDRPLQIIDTPTTEVLDNYGYEVSFRFGKDGNLQNKSTFGIFKRLNLGFGLDGENVIGTGNTRMNKPTMNVKFRIFDGKAWLPSLALGFDGQGYVYNRKSDEYEQREKGFYLVAGREIIWPDLMLNAGVNKFDFNKSNTTRAFGSLAYTYEKIVGFMVEYDHATQYDERRLNFGLKYFITPVFTVDAIGRNVPKFPGASSRETERVVRLVYKGTF